MPRQTPNKGQRATGTAKINWFKLKPHHLIDKGGEERTKIIEMIVKHKASLPKLLEELKAQEGEPKQKTQNSIVKALFDVIWGTRFLESGKGTEFKVSDVSHVDEEYKQFALNVYENWLKKKKAHPTEKSLQREVSKTRLDLGLKLL